MSRTIKCSKRPKSKLKNAKKFFGFRDGYTDGMSNPKKGEDFINYGYPFDCRTKFEIKQHIENELVKELINEYEMKNENN